MKLLKSSLISYILLLFTFNTYSQILVKDLNPGIGDAVESYGTQTLQIVDKIYFIASVDGTKQGLYVIINDKMELLKELCNNCASTSQLFLFKGKLHFTNTENGVQKIYEADSKKESVKLVFEYGKDSYSSIIIPTENKLYYYERNIGIHVFENGIDKIIPDTRFLGIDDDNSPDKNRALIEDGKLLIITKPASDTVALLEISDKVVRLGKVKVDFGSDNQHGLKKVKNGYIFVYDGKLFNFKTSNKTITPVNLSSNTGSILRVLDFKPNQPLLYVFNNGIFVINDSETLSVTKISNIWDSVVQGSTFAKASYSDKMLFLSSDYNTSFKSYAILTDGTKTGTIENKINTYPSSLIQNGRHVFFAAGITNGFNPSIYYFDMEKTEPKEIKAFTEKSNNLTSIIPIGVIGSKLYYFSNLDTKYGRELYFLETGIKTKTNDAEIIVEKDYFKLKSVGDEYMIQTQNNEFESLEISEIDINGRTFNTFFISSNEPFTIPVKNQMIFIAVKSKISSAKGIFKIIKN
jgi:hypothetical protein